jgi:phosphatidylglycerophosphate synthase
MKQEKETLSVLKRNLADFLTISRVVAGFIILSLSFVGESAYLTAIILTLVGAATDMLDGAVARRYLEKEHEGRFGKYDGEIDTFLVLSTLAYFSFSGIVIHPAVGLGWIGLVLVVYVLSRRDLRVQVVAEAITVIALLLIALLYNPTIFWLVVTPAMGVGILINRRRLMFLLFHYWPAEFTK